MVCSQNGTENSVIGVVADDFPALVAKGVLVLAADGQVFPKLFTHVVDTEDTGIIGHMNLCLY